MGFITAERVCETSTTTGTGDFTLNGAVAAYRSLASAVDAIGDKCFYTIEIVDSNGAATGDFECGIGTYSGTSTLTRTTVFTSSNAGAKVSFGSGTKRVYLSPLSREMRFMPTTLLASDYTNSTVTLSDLTGLSFDAQANAVYEVAIFGEMQAAATGTGIGFALTVPSGAGVSGEWVHPANTTQTATMGWQNASGVVGAKTSGVPAVNTSYPVQGRFRVQTSSTAGNVKLQACSEVASSQITVKAGFALKARRID